MATQSTASVLVVDVGATMCAQGTALLEKCVEFATTYIQKKMFYSDKDEIGIMLYGSKDTKNRLDGVAGSYKNAYVIREITTPDLSLLQDLKAIAPGNNKSDVVDALVITLDMFQNKFGDGKREVKREIILITDGASPTNFDDIDVIKNTLFAEKIRLTVVSIGFDVDPTEEKTKTVNFLRETALESGGKIYQLDHAEELTLLISRKTTTRPGYRGDLEITPRLKIPVWSYNKVVQSKYPSFKTVSRKAAENNIPNTTIKSSKQYFSKSNLDKEIPLSNIIKGYKYGKSLIPVSKADEKEGKYKSEACLTAIGFTGRDQIPRYFYMSHPELIVPYHEATQTPPEPNEDGRPHDKDVPTILMSALVRAMEETELVAIVRYVTRANAAPSIGLLLPYISTDLEALYYLQLPFADDIRSYYFGSLESPVKASLKPSADQLDVMDKLIDSLDLTSDGKEEKLKPNKTLDPVLQRYYQIFQSRYLDGQSRIPESSDPSLLQSPLQESSMTYLRLLDVFPRKRIVKEESKKRNWGTAFNTSEAIALDSYLQGPDAKKGKKKESSEVVTLHQFMAGGVEDVGAIHPAEDFQEMLARKDVDLVDKAIVQLRDVISRMVESSVRDSHYSKALHCLGVLREGCVREDEAVQFNTILRAFKAKFVGKRKDFWERVVQEKLSLITESESDESAVTTEEAEAFLEEDKPETVSVLASNSNTSGDNAASLFDMAE